MYKFNLSQKVIDIAGVKIGGQPGEWPTVMCGSIFYGGHKIVSDASEGIFDKGAARELLQREEELAEQFGMQRLPDIIGDTTAALIKYVDFVLQYVDGPILVDSASVRTLLETFQRYSGSEVMDRLVYSPIDGHHKNEHFEMIKKLGIKNALLLAFSPEAIMPMQKFELLLGKDWESDLNEGTVKDGLLGRAMASGIENVLVDVGVIDLQGTAWSALGINQVKKLQGLPAGCAPANALFSWQRKHKERLLSPAQVSATGTAVYASTIYWGADFVLYGPMRCAEWAYPACAVNDALMAYGARLSGIRPKEKSHPLYNLK
ncbi:MAG: hypothetical protein PHS89_10520 [Syntrophaceticus schinkii]|nr:hypothetical protein [Syntrophaceticus schinkii]